MSAFSAILEQFFQLEEHNSDVVTELRAGVVLVLYYFCSTGSNAGMDFGAVMTATCLAPAIGCLIMGLWANYPIALAPGMGYCSCSWIVSWLGTWCILICANGILSFSIADEYLNLFCGKAREVHWCIYQG